MNWFPLDTHAIKKLIPHREPFLLVDRVLEVTEKTPRNLEGRTCHAQKDILKDADFFKGHFPGNPVMPGVLIIEAIAQTGALCCCGLEGDAPIEKVFFGGLDNVRFKRPVLPGELLDLKIEMTKSKASFVWGKGTAFVNEELAVRTDILAHITFKK